MGGLEKISSEHLARIAVTYVRQSTSAQVRNNVESRELQYELKERAVALGWPAERVRVIDSDLGISAASTALADREGFRELAGEVALGHVGLIVGVEVSRLARDNSAWYQLLDVCALTGTLIADSDGIYDPGDHSDRLLLGLKGTIAEAEHHLIKSRLVAGLKHKAAKGELRLKLAPGYQYAPDGEIVISADEAVREAVATVFRRFFELCSVRQVVLSLREDGLLMPRRRGHGEVEWVKATYSAVHDMLTNPTYAGAYAFGRRQRQRRVGGDGRARVSMVPIPRERWHTLILDHHEAYITWEQYEQILEQITRNAPTPGEGAAAREGQALLQGLLRCGHCSRRMRSAYSGARSRQGYARRYYCDPREGEIAYNAPDGKECQGLGGRQLDEAVLEEVFRVLEPAAVAATAKALAGQETSQATRLRAFELAVERARYEADRARRQYDACEPENRLVARTLEANWEKALREAENAEAELAAQRARRTSPLTNEELERLQRAGADLRAIFQAPTTSQRDRKLLLRALIHQIVVTVEQAAGTIDATITWQGGATTALAPLALHRRGQTYRESTPEQTVALVRRLAAHYDDQTIATVLARQHHRTATGLRPTKRRIAQLRDAHGIPPFVPDEATASAEGQLVGVRQAAAQLDVTPATVYRWLRDGYITGERPTADAPWRIRLNAQLRSKVAQDAPDGWLSLHDAARALGVVRQTVLHKVQRGELAAVHVCRGKRKGLRIQVKPDDTGLFDTP
ncbi:MAG: recombinase family protein [Solirubrobacteraceae bacterium]|jgi:DNA invertase Pin-like site-specific DNA recombinase